MVFLNLGCDLAWFNLGCFSIVESFCLRVYFLFLGETGLFRFVRSLFAFVGRLESRKNLKDCFKNHAGASLERGNTKQRLKLVSFLIFCWAE